ncbi:hypothetical protein SBOR_4299 [Sclerotinia borealis F-4128]|uniref:Uncharacterized protein n=1 Tax=Sclerotinia borealis (strain F-4128) TaxID=1432307 RepID=W9CL23_SCLBF|nr:hypothetical protein SBOR_4299 [Sclerotinia borealis F-4128]
MSFNSSFFGNDASPYISPYSSNSSSESLRLSEEVIPKVEETRRASPRRIAVPSVIVTTATPVASLLPSAFSPKRKYTRIIKLKLPKQSFARGVTKPASRQRPSPRTLTTMATKLVPVYDFYYPAQTLGNLPFANLLDPQLFAAPKPATTYSEIILPQLRELIANIKFTTDKHLMTHIPRLVDLVALLSQFPDFGLGTNNLAAFRKHVCSFFATARTQEEAQVDALLAIEPEKDLRMVFRIFDDLYTYNFPRCAACLIYPDDFEHKSGGETVSNELACLCPDQYEVDIDSSEPLLLYKQGWASPVSYVVTASFSEDVSVHYPMYYH